MNSLEAVLLLSACVEAPGPVSGRAAEGAAGAPEPTFFWSVLDMEAPGVSLMADLPAEISVARSRTFEACRESDGCWVFDAPDKLVASDVSLELDLDTAGSHRINASMELRKPVVPNRTTIKAREPNGATHELLDERVFYENVTRVLGPNCATSFRGAVIDRRSGSLRPACRRRTRV